MTTPVAKHRAAFTDNAARLRRARRLYARFIWKKVPDQRALTLCARRAIERGLWKSPVVKDTRYGILRIWWKLEGGQEQRWKDAHMGWHQWLNRSGFAIWGDQ